MSFFTPLSGNATVTSSSSLRTWLDTTTPAPRDGCRTWSPARNFVSPARARLRGTSARPVLHPGEEDDRELEPLHRVQRDERGDRFGLGEFVLVRNERDLLQERGQLLVLREREELLGQAPKLEHVGVPLLPLLGPVLQIR